MLNAESMLAKDYTLWHICIGHFTHFNLPWGWDQFALTRIYPIEDES